MLCGGYHTIVTEEEGEESLAPWDLNWYLLLGSTLIHCANPVVRQKFNILYDD